MCVSIVSSINVTVSPKIVFKSSSAPVMMARNTCHNFAAKLILALLLHSVWRICVIVLHALVCLAMTSRQNRIADKMNGCNVSRIMIAVFFQQTEMLLGFFKIHFDRPAHGIQSKDVRGCQACIRT